MAKARTDVPTLGPLIVLGSILYARDNNMLYVYYIYSVIGNDSEGSS